MTTIPCISINFALAALKSMLQKRGNEWKKIDNYLVHGFTATSLLQDIKFSFRSYISLPVFIDTVVLNLFASYKLGMLYVLRML